ncbi:MAG: hypothetical protein PGN19_15460 [Pseudomonas oryzihabitans]
MDKSRSNRQALWKAIKDPRFIPVVVAAICILLFFIVGLVDVLGN